MGDFIQSNKKLKLEYPCDWTFKLIGENQDLIQSAAKEIVGNKQYHIESSNQSKGGKYVSMTLILEVSSDTERIQLYEKMKNHVSIKMVL
jgi:uncharacterized protein